MVQLYKLYSILLNVFFFTVQTLQIFVFRYIVCLDCWNLLRARITYIFIGIIFVLFESEESPLIVEIRKCFLGLNARFRLNLIVNYLAY